MDNEQTTTLVSEKVPEDETQEVKFECGFVIGVTENGKIHFEPIGTDVRSVTMLGLLALAESKIKHQTGIHTPGVVFDQHIRTLESAMGSLLKWIEESKTSNRLIYTPGESDTLR